MILFGIGEGNVIMERNSELVSVIITTYKRELNVLMQAVDSVRDQTYDSIEIIIIDDNGKDSEFSKLNFDMFGNMQGIRYFVNEKNSGAQFSRNRGVLLSKGNYVAFLDDDDVWMPQKIEKQMALFTNSNVGMVFCDAYLMKDDGDCTEKYQGNPVFDRSISLEMLLFNDYIGSTSQALIKKECFAKCGLFDVDMPARQDYEMWLRISKFYDIYGVNEPLWYYRIHEGERISTNLKKCLIAYKKMLKKHKEEFKKHSYAKAKFLLRICKVNFQMKKYVQAVGYFIWAMLKNIKCVYNTLIKHSMEFKGN